MAEEKKKEVKKNTDTGASKKSTVPKKTAAKNADKKPQNKDANKNKDMDLIAVKQTRSLIMFVAAVILASIIFIPGDMIWLGAHNIVRGFFSMLALVWPVLLLFLAVATMLDRQIPKLLFRMCFTAGFAASLNACIYIFTYGGVMDIRQAYMDGIRYSGGGILGFILGAPFIKLFGLIPAKILIILVMLVLLVFALDIPVKNLYSMLFRKITDGVKSLIKELKNRKARLNPIRIADDAYFDDDDDFEAYEEYDIEADDEFESSFDADMANYDEPPKRAAKSLKDKPAKSSSAFVEAISDNDVDSYDDDDFFGDIDFEEDTPPQLTEEYSIDIDIDSPMEKRLPSLSKKPAASVVAENKEVANHQEYAVEPKQQSEADIAESDEITEDDIFDDLFDNEFIDTKESGYSPDASNVASDISKNKSIPKKSAPEQKQFDPQTVPVEQPQTSINRDKRSYKYPVTELLSENEKKNVSYESELKENAKKLIETLESFSVRAKIVGYCRGPSITRYEIQPAPGVKISKITGLSDDIALNLAADGVRMEAPIPGKPAIGIEIPNKTITPVSIRELLESDEFKKHIKTRKLECVLGRDVAGKIILTDLAKMPHLLIAGTTGSGKSVCVNSILMSILFRASPDEVKMILIDPKLVEFSKYKGIPHLLVPVVSDVKKAAAALNWAVNEMEERYKTFSDYNVKDIDSYNRMVEKNLASMTEEELEEVEEGEVIDGEYIPPRARIKMSRIVIAIDELADLMMVAPGEVEESICRIAQKARAAGMHLVIATQRPSVNVITGVIKANIPSRISLKVASYVDSKTILDTGGGEKLIGRGDMLYSPVGIPKPIRVQGGYSSDDDIEAVTDFIKGHSNSDYDKTISEQIEQISECLGSKPSSKESTDSDDLEGSDAMLEDAIKLVVEAGQASTSLLQRRLRLGYARAGRLIDTMEQMGIVGPHEGSKSRKVLMTQQQWVERQVMGSVEDD